MARTVYGARANRSSNTTPSGAPQGTMGGRAQGANSRPGRRSINLGDEMYLWLLLAIEVGAMAWLRKITRRHHGG